MNKNLKIILIVLGIIVIGVLVFYFFFYNKNVMLGSDRDSHGCIGSAGYSWCESKSKCLRTWEEVCQ